MLDTELSFIHSSGKPLRVVFILVLMSLRPRKLLLSLPSGEMSSYTGIGVSGDWAGCIRWCGAEELTPSSGRPQTWSLAPFV